MTTLFISDLHLDPRHWQTCQWFTQFINQYTVAAEKLYILGDLFEVWIGDDHYNHFNRKIRQLLQNLTQRMSVYILHGNRDFLLGERFARETGCQLLNDPSVIDLYGMPTLITHGDLLCIDDIAYQRVRRRTRDRLFQQALLKKSLWLRRLMASYYRYRSKKITTRTDTILMDASLPEIKRLMQHYQVSLIIHGHTHRPSIDFLNAAMTQQRIVLGDWHQSGNVLVCKENGEKRLVNFI